MEKSKVLRLRVTEQEYEDIMALAGDNFSDYARECLLGGVATNSEEKLPLNEDVATKESHETKADSAVEVQPTSQKKVGPNEAKEPFGICKKHGGFYKSCHC